MFDNGLTNKRVLKYKFLIIRQLNKKVRIVTRPVQKRVVANEHQERSSKKAKSLKTNAKKSTPPPSTKRFLKWRPCCYIGIPFHSSAYSLKI